MSRVDSKELRILIRRQVDAAIIALENDGQLLLPGGENSVQLVIENMVTVLEALNDYEAALPRQIISTRAAQENQLV